MPLPVDEFSDVLSLVMRAWRALCEMPAMAALPPGRLGLRRYALSREPSFAKSSEIKLQTAQTGSYPARPVVATEIKWDTLAGRLIEGRTYRGLTRRQLCKLAGYSSETTLRQYESGRIMQPREDIVHRFADALGCDPVWLMYGRGERNWS